MTRRQFYSNLEALLELSPGSITGNEELAKMESWDSMADVSFIAMADKDFNVILKAVDVASCRTVADLARLFPDRIND